MHIVMLKSLLLISSERVIHNQRIRLQWYYLFVSQRVLTFTSAVQTSNWFHTFSNTLVPNYVRTMSDEQDKDAEEEKSTSTDSTRLKKRAKKEMLICKVREEMLTPEVRNRISEDLMKFYVNIHK